MSYYPALDRFTTDLIYKGNLFTRKTTFTLKRSPSIFVLIVSLKNDRICMHLQADSNTGKPKFSELNELPGMV